MDVGFGFTRSVGGVVTTANASNPGRRVNDRLLLHWVADTLLKSGTKWSNPFPLRNGRLPPTVVATPVIDNGMLEAGFPVGTWYFRVAFDLSTNLTDGSVGACDWSGQGSFVIPSDGNKYKVRFDLTPDALDDAACAPGRIYISATNGFTTTADRYLYNAGSAGATAYASGPPVNVTLTGSSTKASITDADTDLASRRLVKYTDGAEVLFLDLAASNANEARIRAWAGPQGAVDSFLLPRLNPHHEVRLLHNVAGVNRGDAWFWLDETRLALGYLNDLGTTFGSMAWERVSSMLHDDGHGNWFFYGSELAPMTFERPDARDGHPTAPWRRMLARRAPHVNASDGQAHFARPYYVAGPPTVKPVILAKSTGLHFVPLLDDLASPLGSTGLPQNLLDLDTVEVVADGKTKTFLVLRKSAAAGNQHNCMVLQSEV